MIVRWWDGLSGPENRGGVPHFVLPQVMFRRLRTIGYPTGPVGATGPPPGRWLGFSHRSIVARFYPWRGVLHRANRPPLSSGRRFKTENYPFLLGIQFKAEQVVRCDLRPVARQDL